MFSSFLLTFRQQLFQCMEAQEAELLPQQKRTLPLFTAFMDDASIDDWTNAYHIFIDYSDRTDVFHRYIVRAWRERYPTLAAELTDEELALASLRLLCFYPDTNPSS
jgi:hypothetical protein